MQYLKGRTEPDQVDLSQECSYITINKPVNEFQHINRMKEKSCANISIEAEKIFHRIQHSLKKKHLSENKGEKGALFT